MALPPVCLLTSLDEPAPAAPPSSGAEATLCSSRATPRSTAPVKPAGGMRGWVPASAACSSPPGCWAVGGPGLWLVDSDTTGPWGVPAEPTTRGPAGCGSEGWAPSSTGVLCEGRMPGAPAGSSTGASCCCRWGDGAGSVGLNGWAACASNRLVTTGSSLPGQGVRGRQAGEVLNQAAGEAQHAGSLSTARISACNGSTLAYRSGRRPSGWARGADSGRWQGCLDKKAAGQVSTKASGQAVGAPTQLSQAMPTQTATPHSALYAHWPSQTQQLHVDSLVRVSLGQLSMALQGGCAGAAGPTLHQGRVCREFSTWGSQS